MLFTPLRDIQRLFFKFSVCFADCDDDNTYGFTTILPIHLNISYSFLLYLIYAHLKDCFFFLHHLDCGACATLRFDIKDLISMDCSENYETDTTQHFYSLHTSNFYTFHA